jgi:DNA polymerase III subunit alpha
VLDPTHGVLLYGDQVAALLGALGFQYEWADGFRRALAMGQRARRIDMERELKSAAQQRRWTDEQINALLGLRQEHAGYLYAHGHALALAQHVLTQACAKVNPETAAAFFCDVLNNGGSAHYGLGAAVEEARRWGVVMLGPCVNRSTDRFDVDNDALEGLTPEVKGQQSVGAIRVPLNAIRGIGTEAARHIIAMRTAFGPFTSLLDFRQRIERGMLDRRGLLALIKLGAFDFTALPRAQLAMAEQVYSATADLLLASDRHPAAIAPLEEGLTELVLRAAGVGEWPPEVLAADELAYLGFYVGSDLHKHAMRIAEEFSTIDIAQLGGHPHNAPVSIAGLVTSLRVRQTKKGEEMAWLSISDASGSVSCAIFPNAYARLGQPAVLREGAFLVARGRLAHEEASGTNVWIDSIIALSGIGAHLRALATAVDHQADRARA